MKNNQNKRVIVFCTHAYPYRGGLEKNVLELASRLASRGTQVDLCCFNSEGVVAEEDVRGVHFYRLPAFKFLGGAYTLPNIFTMWAMLRKLSQNNYDIVFTQTRFFFSTFIGFFFAHFCKVALVHVERGTTYVRHHSKIISFIAWAVDNIWGRFMLPRVNTLIGVSKRAVAFAEMLGGRNGVLIHNGIIPRGDDYKPRNGDLIRIAYAGRMVSGKGIFVLLDALQKLPSDIRSKIIVDLYGAGAADEEMKERITRQQLGDFVELRGEVDSEQLRDLLRDVDIFINPSFSEGLPTSVIEAGEAGCAVIATDVGGTDEIISHEHSGLIIQPYDEQAITDSICTLVSNPNLCEAYGRRAQEHIRTTFDWKHITDSYEALISRIGLPGQFVISLDFELMWGVRDKQSIDSYGSNILGGRAAISNMLRMFEQYGISASWATVGALFAQNTNELARIGMPSELIPSISSEEEKYYFAPEIIETIRKTPGQEIAGHTFSHYYCLEEGDKDAFVQDMQLLNNISKQSISSFVVPRNQVNPCFFDSFLQLGITSYRGNEHHYLYRSGSNKKEALWKSLLRLADSYINLSGKHTHKLPQGKLQNITASKFLRPYMPRLAWLEGLKVRRITSAMTTAARKGEMYHLWWHPHNFGSHTEKNFANLEKILRHYQSLKDTYGMQSSSMKDIYNLGR